MQHLFTAMEKFVLFRRKFMPVSNPEQILEIEQFMKYVSWKVI